MKEIILPQTLDEDKAFQVIGALHSAREENCIRLDFSKTKFAFPLATLLLASELRTLATNNHVQLRATGLNGNAASYLAHVGFFKAIAFDVGNQPGKSGTDSYIPITIVRLEDFNEDSDLHDAGDHFGPSIDKRCRHLATLLTQDKRPKINKPIAYCLREIMRNVFEHADTPTCVVQGQRWASHQIEIAIVDRGIGIRKSLQKRFDFQTDDEAINAATRPGVSRVDPTAADQAWTNSGFGLYVLSEIGKHLGVFTLCSGTTTLNTTNGRTHSSNHPAFHGTAVGLKIRQVKTVDFESLMTNIVSEGEAIAKQHDIAIGSSKSMSLY